MSADQPARPPSRPKPMSPDLWFDYPLRQALRDHFTLELSITDACDLSCRFCCHGTPLNNDKRHVSASRLAELSHQVRPYEFFSIKISGGEPTIHPSFREICESLRTWFPAHHYCMATNGKRLLQHKDVVGVFDMIEVSHYPGSNDETIRKIECTEFPGTDVVISERADGEGMKDVRQENNVVKTDVFKNCRYPAWKKVIQGRIYPCSNVFGQALRQGFSPESVSVPLDGSWREGLAALDIEEHCRRCWVRTGLDSCRIL